MRCADCPDLPNGTRKRQHCCLGDGLLKRGDVLPMPTRRLDIRPAHFVDDKAKGPRGVFRNGRGK